MDIYYTPIVVVHSPKSGKFWEVLGSAGLLDASFSCSAWERMARRLLGPVPGMWRQYGRGAADNLVPTQSVGTRR